MPFRSNLVSPRRARAAVILLALAALVAAGCSRSGTSRRELSQRQRDSTLGASAIPGAFGVKHALRASDNASRHAATFEVQVDSLAE